MLISSILSHLKHFFIRPLIFDACSLPLSPSLVASSATSIDVVSNATRKDLVSAMASGVFCNNIADSMLKSNVTGLSSPDQISAIRAICKSTSPRVAFVSNVVPTAYRPSSPPTSRPLPYRGFMSTDTTKHLVTVPFLGYMFIILLLGCLRCAPCLFGCGTLGKDEGSPHLYDILVILNDEEEAIFENIRHEDITFFRRFVVVDYLPSCSSYFFAFHLFSFIISFIISFLYLCLLIAMYHGRCHYEQMILVSRNISSHLIYSYFLLTLHSFLF